MRKAGDRRQKQCIVVLVHGTFAADADWVKSNSPLRKQIEQALFPVVPHFEVFYWPGALGFYNNTHSARYKAGMRLRALLVRLCRKEQPTKLFIVAHSHGGNVACYALAEPGAYRVDGLVCLGTPFLELRPRSSLSSGVRLIQDINMLLGFALRAALRVQTSIIIGMLLLTKAILSKALEPTDVLAAVAVGAVLGVVAQLLASEITHLRAGRTSSSRPCELAQGRQIERILRLSRSLTAQMPQTRVFCCWSENDEAFVALRVAGLENAWPFLLANKLHSLAWGVSFAGVLIGVLWWFLKVGPELVHGDLFALTLLSVAFFKFIIVIPWVLVFGTIKVVALFAKAVAHPISLIHTVATAPLRFLFFGPLDYTTEMFCDVRVSREPHLPTPGHGLFLDKRYTRIDQSLSHSLHSDAKVVADVAEWIALRGFRHRGRGRPRSSKRIL